MFPSLPEYDGHNIFNVKQSGVDTLKNLYSFYFSKCLLITVISNNAIHNEHIHLDNKL